MPDYVLIPLMALTLIIPWATIAAGLGFRFSFAPSDGIRIILTTVTFFIAAYFHAYVAVYSYEEHSEWWVNGKVPLGVMYVPAVICLMILTAIGEEVIDQRRRKQRH